MKGLAIILSVIIILLLILLFGMKPITRQKTCPRGYDLSGDTCYEQCGRDEDFGPWCKIPEDTIATHAEYNRAHSRPLNAPGNQCDAARIPHLGRCYDICRPGYEFGDTPATCRKKCPNGYIRAFGVCHRPASMRSKKFISASG